MKVSLPYRTDYIRYDRNLAKKKNRNLKIDMYISLYNYQTKNLKESCVIIIYIPLFSADDTQEDDLHVVTSFL